MVRPFGSYPTRKHTFKGQRKNMFSGSNPQYRYLYNRIYLLGTIKMFLLCSQT